MKIPPFEIPLTNLIQNEFTYFKNWMV